MFVEKERLKKIKIIDFGFADYCNKKNFHKCGTYGFMAPEVASIAQNQVENSYVINEKCDIFSIGCIMYKL
jgi:serine/threonine protein kinase